MFGLNYIIFRPHNVYGERQNIGDKYRNVVGIFMNQIMQDNPLTIFGDGEQQRAFTYIGDVAPVIANSIFNQSAYNDVFNIGSDTFSSVNRLVNIVAGAMGAEVTVKHLLARNEVVNAYSDHSKVRSVLGYEDITSLEDGVKKMAIWAKKEGAKQSKKFENIEILKNLPPSWA
jgi:UDP-glucose 4-epimerase